MYVAVKGGEKAIDAAHRLLEQTRRGDTSIPELSVKQICHQMPHAVDRVMTEGNIFDRELAGLAIKQAAGDMIEAIFLLRAYRTTLPRLQASETIDTAEMAIARRISATYKDLPGGQVLGPTFDYTHRLLDFSLLAENQDEEKGGALSSDLDENLRHCPKVMNILEKEGLMREECNEDKGATDIARDAITYPCDRSARLQALVRGDEGFLLSLGYSTQRGYGRNHPFAGEIRTGAVSVSMIPEELGFAIEIGDIEVTECEMVTGFDVPEDNTSQPEKSQFTRGYGLVFGAAERKAMAMALVDRALQCRELNEEASAPAQQEEFVLSHCDNVDAAGFLSHLKLPHYVDFQSELELLRTLRKEYDLRHAKNDNSEGKA
ncbi:MAG: carbon-phosphorus lyase complex subunit PhnI [Endozoicomonas sp.]